MNRRRYLRLPDSSLCYFSAPLLPNTQPASLVLIDDDFRYLTNCMLLFELCLVVTRLCPAPFHRPGRVG